MIINQNKLNIPTSKPLAPSKNEAVKSFKDPYSEFSSFLNVNDKNINSAKINTAYKSYFIKPSVTGYKEINTFTIPNIGTGKVYEFNNGSKVVILPKAGPTTVAYTGLEVGSNNDNEKVKGLGHCLEHILANYQEFSKIGAISCAETNSFRTNYYAQSMIDKPEDVENLIKVHFNRLHPPNFNEKDLDDVRKTIINEINYKSEQSKSLINRDILIKNLFNLNHYTNSSYEKEKSLNNITSQDLIDHYNNYYTPNNMTTVIVGNVDLNNTIKTVSKYLNNDVKQNEIKKNKVDLPLNNPIQKTKIVVIKSSEAGYSEDNTDLLVGFVGPKNNDSRDNLIAEAMFDFIKDRHGKFFNFNIDQISSNKEAPKVITLEISPKPGYEGKGLKYIESSLFDLAQKPIDQKDLDALKMKMKTNISVKNEHSLDLSKEIADSIINNKDISGSLQSFKNIDSISANDLQNFAKKYLDLNKASILVVHPKNDKQVLSKKDSSQPVKFKGNIDKQETTYVKLPNNLQVATDTSKGISRTTIDLTLKTDSIPNVKPGLPLILSAILGASIKNNSTKDFQDIIRTNGLDMKTGTSDINCSITCDSDKTLSAINLLRETLYSPNLNQKNFDKAKEDAKNCSDEEIRDEFDNITLQDVKDFYSKMVSNAQGEAVLTMPHDTFKSLKGNIYKSLQNGIPTLNEPKHIEESTPVSLNTSSKNEVTLLPLDSDQATIVQSFKIAENGNIKDHAAISLLDKILGNPYKSRLVDDIREKQKIAYIVDSKYETDGKTGEISLLTTTTTKDNPYSKFQLRTDDNLKKTLVSFRKNINDLINNPVSPEELKIQKKLLKNEIYTDIETSEGRNELFKQGLNTGYGTNYINELFNTIDKIEPKDIQNAAKLYLNKPSVISIIANKETISKNKDYISSLGEVQKC